MHRTFAPQIRTQTVPGVTTSDCNNQNVTEYDDIEVATHVQSGYLSRSEIPYFKAYAEKNVILPPQFYVRLDYTRNRPVEAYSFDACPCGGGKAANVATQAKWYFDYNTHAWSIPFPDPWEGVNSDAMILAAMADILPDLDALTSAVELRRTVDMVVNVRRDAERLIREALRGGKHTVKAASDAWLAWRYGWEQLGRDVSNCYDLLKDPIQNIVLTGQSGSSTTGSDSIGKHQHFADVYRTIDASAQYSWDYSRRARVIAHWRGKTLNALADPAITAWEVVPYSFVADWFVNVGDVLAAWKVRANVVSIFASLGTKETRNCVSTWDSRATCIGGTGGGSVSCLETVVTRKRFPASIPSLVPSIDVSLTSKRIADAAALLSKRIL